MPFCPSCGSEYEKDKVRCPECDEWLTEDAVDQSDDSESRDEGIDTDENMELVLLETYESGMVAAMVADALSEAGIATVYRSDAATGSAWSGGVATAMGPVDLLVPQSQRDEAAEIASRLVGDFDLRPFDDDSDSEGEEEEAIY